MDTATAGRLGGVASGETRLKKRRESVLACRTKRELLEAVTKLMLQEYHRGYMAAHRKARRGEP